MTQQIQIRNVREDFGSEITGLDPNMGFDEETRAILRDTFNERGFLLFPEFDIDNDYQTRLCKVLYGDDGSGTVSANGYNISNRDPDASSPFGRLNYHADMMWHPNPFTVLSLFGAEVDPKSATTSIANSMGAWVALPADIKERIEGLSAVQIGGQVPRYNAGDILQTERPDNQICVKKVVQHHPVTGHPILYVSQMNTREIVGLDPRESEELLELLFSYLYDPKHVYEHKWRKNDLLIIDNVAVQHARGYVDLDGPVRTLRKVIAPVTASAPRPIFVPAAA